MAQKPKTTKKQRKKTKSKKKLKKSSLSYKFIFITLIMLSIFAFGYFLGKKDIKVLDENLTPKSIPENLSKKEKVVEKKVSKKAVSKIETIKAKKTEQINLTNNSKKPKLVIIIDDVSSLKQLKNIKDLPMKVTPSIFPPFKNAKSNHELAIGLKNYMIHLPMESGKSFDKQHGTLKITDSKEKMETRIKEIRKLFPTGRYINNHTGSKFTSNYKAMYMLYETLHNEGFIFVDSRTIKNSKVSKIAQSFGDNYLGRDIFIDNKHTISYIHKQLKKAVKIANKKGYAIAIGHPHFVTMKALESAQTLLKDVEVVYIDKIYKKGKE